MTSTGERTHQRLELEASGGDSEEVKLIRRRRGMRTGYTTGACAAAAARAATQALVQGQPVDQVTIWLPAGRYATFTLHHCVLEPAPGNEGSPLAARAGVVKDAGDDPDVTHGALICARVSWAEQPGLVLKGGEGVGTVTRPGLGLEVGGPAINPVPRQMIQREVGEAAGALLEQRGLVVEISVPGGEQLALKTMNPRLGIIGGISILGTTGIVQPYSTASWRASVEQAIDVAAANGVRHVVLTTGGRSERWARALFPHLPELAFVEMGIFTGHALRRCARHQMERVTICGMIGKFSKLAQGHFQTHVAGNQVDLAFLAEVAAECGASPALQAEIRAANTARHVQEIALAHGLTALFPRLCALVREQALRYVKHAFSVDAIMFDFEGNLLGRAGDGT